MAGLLSVWNGRYESGKKAWAQKIILDTTLMTCHPFGVFLLLMVTIIMSSLRDWSRILNDIL